jgi:hypothetical protein
MLDMLFGIHVHLLRTQTNVNYIEELDPLSLFVINYIFAHATPCVTDPTMNTRMPATVMQLLSYLRSTQIYGTTGNIV